MFWSQGKPSMEQICPHRERDQGCGQTKRKWWYQDTTVYKRAGVGRGQCSRKDKMVVSPGEARQNGAKTIAFPGLF
jgi:hypothetical protein